MNTIGIDNILKREVRLKAENTALISRANW